MEDKIYEKIKEQQLQSSSKYIKAFGAIDDESEITGLIPKKNFDLFIILTKLGLAENNDDTQDTINEFHDYLFKLGINIGVGLGKRTVIESIQQGTTDFEKIMEVDAEEIVNYNFEPTFISDMKEAIKNDH